MPEPDNRLQVLIANERDDRLESVKAVIEGLGHEIVGQGTDIAEVAALSRSTGAEIALVGLGLDGDHALEQARSSPAVVDALGTPIEPEWYLTGTINVTGASGNADIAIPISGPKGAGTLYASARKRAGLWNYDVLEVALDAGGERIDLRSE